MQRIKDLLNQIKWDKRKNPDEFSIFYLDRIKNELIEVPFNSIKKIEGNFIVISKETYIPMHRIKKVKRKGIVIWRR